MQLAHYHDVGLAPGKTLDQYESKAKKQEELIRDFFKSWPGGSFTAVDILHAIKWNRTPPVVSIRRALTNLERDNWIVKTGIREGLYGRANGVYKLK